MADHIERVIVQGEVELNTGNAAKQLDNLKKPIKVELDLQSSKAIAEAQKEINALLRKVNNMDFDGLKESLTKSITNGSKDGIKEAERLFGKVRQKMEKKYLILSLLLCVILEKKCSPLERL